MKILKSCLVLFMLITSSAACAQHLLDSKWHINTIMGWDTLNFQEYTLSRIEQPTIGGNILSFNEDQSFGISYTAPCGNDCFPSSTGTYTLIDKEHIQLHIHHLDRKGDCDELHQKVNFNFGMYYIYKKSENEMRLIKSDGNTSQDLRNEAYSARIDKFVKEEGSRISGFPYYETDIQNSTGRINDFIKTNTTVKNYSVLYTKGVYGWPAQISLIKNEDLKDAYFFVISVKKHGGKFMLGDCKMEK